VSEDEDIFARFRRWLDQEGHEERHHHHRHTVDLLFLAFNQQGVNMTEQILNVSPPTVTVDAALGSVRDIDGNVVSDPVASGTWSVDDAAVGSIAAGASLGAVVTLTGTAGTLNVTFTGTTQSGASVTGAGQIVVSVSTSGAVSVDVTLTAVAPA